MVASPGHRPPIARRDAVGAVVVAGLIALAAGPIVARLLPSPAIALGALAPPLLVATALLLARRHDGAVLAGLAAFAWGAAGATVLAATANDALSAWVATLVGEAPARALVPIAGGPVVEELAKGAGLLAILAVAPRAVRGVVPGMACGALVGLGFTMTENVGYLTRAALEGGMLGVERAIWVRAVVGGFTHAVFTGIVGAGLGWAADRGRRASRAVPGAAFLAAVAQHAAWNAIPAQWITALLCDAPVPGGPCRDGPGAATFLVLIPLVTLAGLAPGVIALFVLASRPPSGPSAAA